MQHKNDEWLFLKAFDEATRACVTLSAQVVFVKQKLERVSSSRLSKLLKDSEGDPSLLERDRAIHYATLLPWNVLQDEVYYSVRFLDSLEPEDRNSLLSSPSSAGSDEPMED